MRGTRFAIPAIVALGLSVTAAAATEVETTRTYRSESYRMQAAPPPPRVTSQTIERRTEVQGSSGGSVQQQTTIEERRVSPPSPPVQSQTTVQKRVETVETVD